MSARRSLPAQSPQGSQTTELLPRGPSEQPGCEHGRPRSPARRSARAPRTAASLRHAEDASTRGGKPGTSTVLEMVQQPFLTTAGPRDGLIANEIKSC